MRLMEQETTIGVELEMYGDRCAADVLVAGKGLNVCGDASLGSDGVEVKFDKGVPIKDSMPRLNLLKKIVTDSTSIMPEFTTTHNNKLIPESIRQALKVHECSSSYRFGNVGHRTGTTGLHVHMGVPENYSFLDLLALSDYLAKNDKKVRELSWRDSKVWAKTTRNHLVNVFDGIHLAATDTGYAQRSRNETRFYGLYRIAMDHDKYMGMNIRNVGEGYHTVEFRYADSLLLADMTAFKKYLKFLAKAHRDHFTNCKEFTVSKKVNGRKVSYTLKEAERTDHEYIDIKAKKYVYDVFDKNGTLLTKVSAIR